MDMKRLEEIEGKLTKSPNGRLVWRKMFRPKDAEHLIQTIKQQQEQIELHQAERDQYREWFHSAKEKMVEYHRALEES